jgi:hypothetical protein
MDIAKGRVAPEAATVVEEDQLATVVTCECAHGRTVESKNVSRLSLSRIALSRAAGAFRPLGEETERQHCPPYRRRLCLNDAPPRHPVGLPANPGVWR